MVWCVRIFGLDRCQSEPLKMPEEKPHIYNSEASSIKKCISIYLYVCVWVVKMGWGLKAWVGHMWIGQRCVCGGAVYSSFMYK